MKYPKYAAHFFTTEDGRAVHTTLRTRMMIFLVRTSRESVEWGRDQLWQKDQHSDAIGRAIETHRKREKVESRKDYGQQHDVSSCTISSIIPKNHWTKSSYTENQKQLRLHCGVLQATEDEKTSQKLVFRFLHLPFSVCFYLSNRVDIIRVTRNLLCILSW